MSNEVEERARQEQRLAVGFFVSSNEKSSNEKWRRTDARRRDLRFAWSGTVPLTVYSPVHGDAAKTDVFGGTEALDGTSSRQITVDLFHS